MLADVFPTGFHATEQAHVKPDETVAIFGAGPVGLMAALSAKRKGASEIYVVDNVRERLDLAKQIGATPVDGRSRRADREAQHHREPPHPARSGARRLQNFDERADGYTNVLLKLQRAA